MRARAGLVRGGRGVSEAWGWSVIRGVRRRARGAPAHARRAQEQAAETASSNWLGTQVRFTYSLQLTLRDFGARVSIQPPGGGS
jgi:hypothetical protein